jgi:hypothetical protein
MNAIYVNLEGEIVPDRRFFGPSGGLSVEDEDDKGSWHCQPCWVELCSEFDVLQFVHTG